MVDFGALLNQWITSIASGGLEIIKAVIVLIVFLIIGYIVAKIVCWLVSGLIRVAKVEDIFKKKGVPFKVAGFTITGIITFLLKLFIILAFLGAATQLMELKILTDVIQAAIIYIPSLVQGVILIMAALIFAHYITLLIRKSKEVPVANLVAVVVQVFIAYIALVMALPLILPGVNVGILTQAFVWFIAAAGIALGIGFGVAVGFGLKDSVAKAAAKHPGMFDYLFGEVERGIKKKK